MNPYPLGEHEERFEPKNDLKLPKLEEKLALQSQAPQEATLSSFVDSVSTTAFHNSDAITDSCYPGTRTQLLAGLDKWASTNVIGGENPYIVWLTGIAGSGKTAIMQTFAERASERVSASFFFCRSDARRNDTKYLLPTLLYQLYHSVPHPQKSRILSSVPLFPLVRNRPLSEQFDILVLNPLRDLFESGHFSDPESRPVIIIDGLDECLDQEKQLEVMDMLFHAIKAGVPFQFLLSSRPDPRIQSVVSAQSPGSAMCQIVLDDTRQNDLDIRLFLEQRMHECRTTHPFRKYLPPDLPSDKDIDHLVYMSSRLFIFASTAMRYIESPRDLPATRLANILGLYADGDQPHAQLDALYAHILQTTSNSAQLLRILALIALSNNRLPISIIAATLQIPPRECEGFLLEIPSLVSVCNQDKLSYINMRHTSLLDFLRDRSRSQEYGIRISDYNAQIIQASTRFVIRSGFNEASLSVLNMPVSTGNNFLEPLGPFICAEAAIVCLCYLSENSQDMKSLVESRQLGHSRLHICWTVHQRTLKKSIPHMKKALTTPFELVPYTVWKIPGSMNRQYRHRMTYRMALIYLTYLLARAEMSHELFQMCQSQTFSPISMQFPNRSRKARCAMRFYVARWSIPA